MACTHKTTQWKGRGGRAHRGSGWMKGQASKGAVGGSGRARDPAEPIHHRLSTPPLPPPSLCFRPTTAPGLCRAMPAQPLTRALQVLLCTSARQKLSESGPIHQPPLCLARARTLEVFLCHVGAAEVVDAQIRVVGIGGKGSPLESPVQNPNLVAACRQGWVMDDGCIGWSLVRGGRRTLPVGSSQLPLAPHLSICQNTHTSHPP